jgi:hypothetical protein
MAADSRISDPNGLLIDQGIKLFEVPIICRKADRMFGDPTHVRSIGMVSVGSTLLFHHMYAMAVSAFGNLLVTSDAVPTNADLADYLARLTTVYVRSLGATRPASTSVGIAVGGTSTAGESEAFRLGQRLDPEDRIVFVPERLGSGPGEVHFMGTETARAERLCAELRDRDEPGAAKERAALNVIRSFIDDPAVESVGGEVQVGFTVGADFRRVASVRPITPGAPPARIAVSTIDLADLGPVGPSVVAPAGMVVP